MPEKKSTADTIIEICEKFGVSIFLDGSDENDIAKIGSPYSYEPNEKILTIFLGNLRPTTWEKIKPYVKGKWADVGTTIDEHADEVYDSVKEYQEENPHADLINTFVGRIPEKDITALKLSLYLRDEKDKGHSIEEHKKNIYKKFSERGIYISNLCNSGYFEEEFTQAIKKLDEHAFDKYYELMVGKELAAIFVHPKLKAIQLRDKFEDTLLNARRFQIPSFRIHGFGSWNVDLIEKFFKSYEADEDGMGDEFDIVEEEHNKYPPSLIYKIVIKEFPLSKR